MKKILVVLLFSCLFLGSFVFAQEITPERTQADNLLTVYQITNDSINRLTITLTFIAGALAIFITGIVLFFAIKQILADKEIKEYKEAIKQNKIAIEEETKKRIKEIEATMEKITEREQKVEKSAQRIEKMEKELKPASLKKIKSSKDLKEAQSALKNLRKEIEELKKELSFQKGKISTVSGLGSTGSIVSSYPLASDVLRVGRYTPDLGTFPLGSIDSKTCSKCSHVNEPGAKFCSNCGSLL